MAHPPRQSCDGGPSLGRTGPGRIHGFARGRDPDPARGPAVLTGPLVMVRGEAVWAIACATLSSDALAKMPEDDDEPDDEPEDKPDDKPDDESDDESEDEPGTLYFGQEDGWTARSC